MLTTKTGSGANSCLPLKKIAPKCTFCVTHNKKSSYDILITALYPGGAYGSRTHDLQTASLTL